MVVIVVGKCRLHLKTSLESMQRPVDECSQCECSPGSSQCTMTGENIIRALQGHFSSLQALHEY